MASGASAQARHELVLGQLRSSATDGVIPVRFSYRAGIPARAEIFLESRLEVTEGSGSCYRQNIERGRPARLQPGAVPSVS